MNDVFIGCYSRPLDGMRLCIPAEWARVFRGRGGVAAVELSGGRMSSNYGHAGSVVIP
jgi:hypothetical protein